MKIPRRYLGLLRFGICGCCGPLPTSGRSTAKGVKAYCKTLFATPEDELERKYASVPKVDDNREDEDRDPWDSQTCPILIMDYEEVLF